MNTILAIIPVAATTSREYIVLLLKVYFYNSLQPHSSINR